MNSVKINFASLSFGASVDQQTGNVSIFDLIEEIRTPQLPITLQSLVIAMTFQKSSKENLNGKLFIHFEDADKKNQLVGNGEMRFPEDQNRMKAVFRFGGFPIQKEGEHRFIVSCLNDKDQKVAESILRFEVIRVNQTPREVNSNNGNKPTSH